MSHKVADGPSADHAADVPFRPDFVKVLIILRDMELGHTGCVPESPSLGLNGTVLVQLHRLLYVKCCAVDKFNCTEVVRK